MRSCSRRRSVTDAACPLRVLIGLRFATPFPFLLQKRKRCRPPKEKRAAQNRKCIPCRHRVRRSQLHSVSAGAAKTPYPQPSSSFPNCDRFTGSQFGHLEFYNAARDFDDGGHFSAYGYGKNQDFRAGRLDICAAVCDALVRVHELSLSRSQCNNFGHRGSIRRAQDTASYL